MCASYTSSVQGALPDRYAAGPLAAGQARQEATHAKGPSALHREHKLSTITMRGSQESVSAMAWRCGLLRKVQDQQQLSREP